MATYRIARKLNLVPRVVEGFVGVRAGDERPVIVKRLVPPWVKESPRFGPHFAFRAAAMRGLPGLPEWLEVGEGRGSTWLVESLREGESLRHLVSALAKEKVPLAPSEGLGVLGRVAALLARLHAAVTPVVHGDVCSSTVLVGPDGGVRLSDPGVTPLLPPSGSTGPARSESYSLAPEQFTGEVGPATDVFRLGLMLYELSTGHALFYALDPVQSLVSCQRFVGISKDTVRSVPEPWQSLLVAMLAVEPRDRPTASEVDVAFSRAASRAGWKAPDDDLARVYAKVCGARGSLEALARGGAQELVLTPVSPADPGAEPRPAVVLPEVEPPAPATNTFNKLPPVAGETPPPPQPTGPPMLHPVPAAPPPGPSSSPSFVGLPTVSLTPPPTPAPGATVVTPPGGGPPVPTPGGTVLARISTRKVSRSELEARQLAEVDVKAIVHAPGPVDDPNGPRDALVGERLVEKGIISAQQLADAKDQVERYGGTLADALASLDACDEDTLVVATAEVTKTPHVTAEKLAAMPAPTEALQRVPVELARALDAVPLGLKGGTQLMVAMKDPMDVEALRRLKEATGLKSVVAMRAGEGAIRRARNRFYTGREEDERPEWLEVMGAERSGVPGPVAPLPPGDEAPLVVPGRIEEAASAPRQPEVGAAFDLEAPAGRLVRSLLTLFGDRGAQAKQLVELAQAVAQRLGVSGEALDKVGFAATALVVANLVDGRPVYDVPTVASLSSVLGEHSWNALEGVLSPWLEWPTPIGDDTAGHALAVSFGFASHAATPRPAGPKAAAALVSFKVRFQLEAPLLEALTGALALEAPR